LLSYRPFQKLPLFHRFSKSAEIREAEITKNDPRVKSDSLTQNLLKKSIQREILCILQTRSYTNGGSQKRVASVIEIPLFFGCMDHHGLDSNKLADYQKLEENFKQTLEKLEPRLHSLTVKVTALSPQKGRVSVFISGYF
jgi:predicted component of type VI protein secretion system